MGSIRGRRTRGLAAALLLYTGLTFFVTWPLPADPARLTTPNDDTYLNTWAMAWAVHQGLTDPLRLYDANIYHPLPLAFAHTETLLPQALQALPIHLLGGGPRLAHNVVLLATFPLAALGAHLLALELGASAFGALLAGLGFGFGAFRNDHLVHVQTLSHQWLPFALLFLLRSLARPTPLNLTALGAFSALQVLSTGYYAVVTGFALGAVLLLEGRSAWGRGSLVRVLIALGVAASLCVVVLAPQLLLRAGSEERRSRAECAHWSARWTSYLDPGAAPALPHQELLSSAFATGEPLYPGLGPFVLGVAGLLLVARSTPARLAAVLAAVGLVLSLGPDVQLGPWYVGGPYELVRLSPLGASLRTPSRMAVLALLGLGLLAALAWTRFLAGRRGARWIAAAIALVTMAEARPAGQAGHIRHDAPLPEAVAGLARLPRGAVLELPWNDWEQAALYMYWSTSHWQPLVNGFGAFQPPGFRVVGLIGRRWPSTHASRQLRARGIRYVVMHLDRVTPAQRARVLEGTLPDGVRLLAAVGDDRVWEIAPLGAGPPLN